MKDYFVDPREYGKMLRNAHPLDRWDANKRVVNAVGRLTAQKLNKDAGFIEAIRNNKVTSAGNKWHNAANEMAKKFAARMQKLGGAELTSEKTIKGGLGGSRADILFERAGQVLAEFDWKTNARSAMKSVGQMARHAAQIAQKWGAKPGGQESRSWIDFVREGAPNAAKFLGNVASLFKSSNKPLPVSSGKDLKPGADAPAVSEWTGSAASKPAPSTKSGASLGARSGTKPSAETGQSAKSTARSVPGRAGLSTRSGQSLGDKPSTPALKSSSSSPKPASGAAPDGLSTRSGQSLGDKRAAPATAGSAAQAGAKPSSAAAATGASAPGAKPAATPTSPAGVPTSPIPSTLFDGRPR